MTNSPKFISFQKSNTQPFEKDISSCVISGNPIQNVWMHANNIQSATKFGMWDCQAGTHQAEMQGIAEFCYIIEGEAEVTNIDTNEVHFIKAGDAFVMEPGFRSQWFVKEYIKKYFVISEVVNNENES